MKNQTAFQLMAEYGLMYESLCIKYMELNDKYPFGDYKKMLNNTCMYFDLYYLWKSVYETRNISI